MCGQATLCPKQAVSTPTDPGPKIHRGFAYSHMLASMYSNGPAGGRYCGRHMCSSVAILVLSYEPIWCVWILKMVSHTFQKVRPRTQRVKQSQRVQHDHGKTPTVRWLSRLLQAREDQATLLTWAGSKGPRTTKALPIVSKRVRCPEPIIGKVAEKQRQLSRSASVPQVICSKRSS